MTKEKEFLYSLYAVWPGDIKICNSCIVYEPKTKDCSGSCAFQNKSWHLCWLLWCLPGFITSLSINYDARLARNSTRSSKCPFKLHISILSCQCTHYSYFNRHYRLCIICNWPHHLLTRLPLTMEFELISFSSPSKWFQHRSISSSYCVIVRVSIVIRYLYCLNSENVLIDENYYRQRTLLTLLRQYRYQTTTNLCLLMWNQCLPVFDFNWRYTVLRPLYNNPPLDYRYRQKTLWTYWTLPYIDLISIQR